jgi:glutathionyl-hydroquinone reductase
MIFNWEFYVNKYDDLKKKPITTEFESWNHWLKYGQYEHRVYNDIPILFDWKNYVSVNNDLAKIITEEESAWKHFLYHGRIENRNIRFNDYLKKYCV